MATDEKPAAGRPRLAGAFSGKTTPAPTRDRTAGLAGLSLAPDPAPPITVHDAAPVVGSAPTVADPIAQPGGGDGPTTADVAPKGGTQRTPTSRKAAGSKAAEAVEAAAPVGIYLAVSTHALLQQQTDLRRGRPQDVVILQAVTAQETRLAQYFTALKPSLGRFSGAARRRRQSHDEPQVAIAPRLTTGDLQILDEMWQAAEAPNRSAYVNMALRFEYADGPSDESGARGGR